MNLPVNTTKTLFRRFLDPSANTLFVVSAVTFCAALYLAIPHRSFIVKGSIGEAEIIEKAKTSNEYTQYLAKLISPKPSPISGIIISDRPNLQAGQKVPVVFQRDDTGSMLIIELFAPWVRSFWLLAASLAALGLGIRERDKSAKPNQ
ncbi:MAG: hypothetical protein CMM58_10855 [Rhodospirillaceae bacterium]|nr:hypothetical protein [Rhodospirillaceae bacterium]|tara:strand:- start:955 stop:1398 length:444 start_codon:yes stop_codon:yes gene_type:complete